MEHKIEDINKSEKKVTFSVDKDTVKKEVNSELKGIKKEAKIPGFRNGKAPMSIIRNRFYPLALKNAQENIMKELVLNFLEEHKELKVVSTPEVRDVDMKEDDSMDFIVHIELLPEVTVKNYKGIPIEKVKFEVTDADVESTIKMMLDRNAEFIDKTDEGIEMGDFVNLDFREIGNEEEEIRSVKDYKFYVGNLNDIPGFENGLLGMKPGEEKEIEVKYPDDYVHEDKRDKEVVYKVKINEVKKKDAPELTDQYVKENFPGLENVKDLKEDIKDKLIEQNKKKQHESLLDQIYTYLMDEYPIDVPDNFLRENMEKMKEQKIRELKMYGYNEDMIKASMNEEHLLSDTEYVIKRQLIQENILEQEKIEVTDEEADAKIEEAYGNLSNSEDEESNQQLENIKKALRDQYRDILKKEKIDDLLIAEAKITEVDPETKKDKEENNE